MSAQPSLDLSPAAAAALLEHLQAGRLRLEIRLVLDEQGQNGAPDPGANGGAPDLLTHDEAAEYLRIGRSTLYDLRRRSEVRVIRLGGRVLIQKEELDRYLASCRDPRQALPLPVARGRR